MDLDKDKPTPAHETKSASSGSGMFAVISHLFQDQGVTWSIWQFCPTSTWEEGSEDADIVSSPFLRGLLDFGGKVTHRHVGDM